MKTYTAKQILLARVARYMDEKELEESLTKLNMQQEDIEEINQTMKQRQFISFFEGVK